MFPEPALPSQRNAVTLTGCAAEARRPARQAPREPASDPGPRHLGGGRSGDGDGRAARGAARRLPEQRSAGPAAERYRHRPKGSGRRHRRRRGLRGGGRGDRATDGEPAPRTELHRGARRGGALRAGPGGADHLVIDPESPHPAHLRGADARPGRGPRSRYRARGGRRLRRQDQHLRRGVRRGGAVEAARPADQVDRGTLRGVPRHRARTRPDRLRRAGGHAERQGARAADAHHRRHRRLQHAAHRPRTDPQHDDGQRHLRVSRHPRDADRGLHQQDPDRCLSRRGSARGGLLRRTGDGHAGSRAGDGPGRPAPEELHPARPVPLQDPDGGGLRFRRLREGARPRP